MTCLEFIEFIGRYLDDELSSQEQRLFDEHLAICVECQAFLKSYRTVIRLGGQVFETSPEDPVPEDVPESLIQAVLAAAKAGS